MSNVYHARDTVRELYVDAASTVNSRSVGNNNMSYAGVSQAVWWEKNIHSVTSLQCTAFQRHIVSYN